MAEFDSEAASLDLFQEFFNQRSSRTVAADEGVVVVHDVVDTNVNKHAHHFLKSPVSNNNIDNDVMLTETNAAGDLFEECTPNGSTLDSDRLNIENLRNKSESTNGNVNRSIDNREGCTDEEGEDSKPVNGDTDALIKTEDKSCGKQKKGISFPKDTFISGYFEPPDPWKNAPSWTTDELVSAYRKSCEALGTKPIAKLIQQLQAIQSPGRQEEVLSLKGEKLDQKQCECLEEVLRRVQFKLIDLEASHLDDECAVALFDMIEYYESACQLNIAFNKNIQARGWQACSRLVRRTPNLTYLDMRSCDLNDRNIPIFGRALKLGCHLTILHMESMNLSGRPLVILVAALKMNETLQELFLADNKLMPTDGVQLGNLLRYNHKLGLLDLRNNHLQDVGSSHICDGLMEQGKGPGLRTMVLWNNNINYQAMPALGRTLAANESLETLNIGHNPLTNEGVHLLKDGLLRTNSLLRLGLQGTRITDEGAVALAEYIADSTVLLRIDLRDNDIKTGGLMALSHAMRVNTSVTRIDLDKEPKKESSMKDYAEQQSHLLRDILTFQQRNIQLAVKKEEKERAELEEKAAAAESSTAADDDEQQTETQLESSREDGDNPSEEVEEEVEENEDARQEKDRKDAENVKVRNTGNLLPESLSQDNDSDQDELDSVFHKDPKPRPRPSVLFPYRGIPPQATLDSPMPTSNVNPLLSVTAEPPSLPLPAAPSQKGLLSLAVGSAPGEMILSPQYFPKQIARKIFSVSRVNEDPSWPPLSTSPTPPRSLSPAFDPLNVSPVPLVPVSPLSSPSIPPSLSASLPPILEPQCTPGTSKHSNPAAPKSVSPSSLLFNDLVEETVRHMVSPNDDIDVKSLLSQGTGGSDASINVELECDTGYPDSSKADPSTATEHSELSKTLLAFQNETGSCCKPQSTLTETGGCAAGCSVVGENIPVENSVAKDLVVMALTKADALASGQGGDLKQDLLYHSENTNEVEGLGNTVKACGSSQEKGASSHSHTFSGDTKCRNDIPSVCEGSGSVRNVSESELSSHDSGGGFDKQSTCSESNGETAAELAGLEAHVVEFVHRGTGDDAGFHQDTPRVKQSSQHDSVGLLINQHDAADLLIKNSKSDKENQPAQTAVDSEQDLALVYINNSSSPLPQTLGDKKELSSVESKKSLEISQEHTCASFEDLSALDIGATGQREEAPGLSVKTPSSDLSNDCADGLVDIYNSVSDNMDIVNVDLSLDEEPWLAVGAEGDGNDSEKIKESLKQPDFFTTFSMNGLTQELASALTSLDGSTTSFVNEDDDIADLQPHDEFEKELDAMLAIVQSELPWPLKGSHRIDS